MRHRPPWSVLALVLVLATCESAQIEDEDAFTPSDLGTPPIDSPVGPPPADAGPPPSEAGPDGASCLRDDDCPEDMLCGVTFPSDGARPEVGCRAPDSEGGRIGQPCVDSVLCVNGESCFAGICRELCATDADCDTREVCSRVKLSASGDPTSCDSVTVVSICHPPCESARDCDPGQRCSPVLKADRRATNGICTPLLPGGATGAPCADLCATDLCYAESRCTERCGDSSHCPDGYTCETIDGFAFSCLPAVAIPVCVPE